MNQAFLARFTIIIQKIFLSNDDVCRFVMDLVVWVAPLLHIDVMYECPLLGGMKNDGPKETVV
jgi:hypothetical protein